MEPRTDQHSGRRAILVVDGDPQIRRLLELSLRNAGFEVRAAGTAPEALKAVGELAPDLIVSETRLEGGPDGFELCRQIKKRTEGPRIAFVFLAEQTVETKLRGVEAGADDFLAKPVYVQEVVAHARSLLQRRERDRLEILARGDERFVGELEDFPLVDLLGALEANHKSGVVVLTAPSGARGEIYFREGAVVDAEAGRLSGLDAVCRLFSWGLGRFEIEWKHIRRKDAVGKEPSALVMEALRRLDEWRRLLADLPPLDTIFEVDYHLLAERLAEIPDEVNGVLRLFDGQRTFIHVVDDCGLSDLDALAVVGKLFREQIIRDVRARPDVVGTPGADIEGWLSEAAGPFRAPPTTPRRDLFGASPEPVTGVHARTPAPVEPLEEAAREPVVAERRERFTDRLIAESAAAAAAARQAPKMAPETTQLGLPAAPTLSREAPETTRLGLPAPPTPLREAPETTQLGLPAPPTPPASSTETTQQGLGAPAPLTTRPGFAAVTPPKPGPSRVARAIPADAAPASRSTPRGLPSLGDGVPQPLPPQSPEPIVIPPATGTAPRIAAALEAPEAGEPRAVAGEILARAPTTKLFDVAALDSLDSPVTRVTDLGLGPAPAVDVKSAPAADVKSAPAADVKSAREASASDREDRDIDARALAPTARAGEVVAGPARIEDVRHERKIILDPAIPEDLAQPSAGPSRAVKLLGVTAGVALAVGAVWFAFRKTGHEHPREPAVAEAPAEVPAIVPAPSADQDKSASSAGTATAAAGTSGESTGVPATAHMPVDPALEERLADPKLARARPAEFPQLLAACRQAFMDNRAKDAETACVAAKDANPDSAEACALLGHALFGRKKRREALQWAERAVALDPRHADAYVIIGGVKQASDDKAAAKAAYRKYLELAPHGQYAADLRAIVDSP
jgi:CheY-like chemotaxis protein